MNEPSDNHRQDGATGLLRAILVDLEGDALHRDDPADEPKARLGDVLDRMDERGFGLLTLLLALPCCLPFLYGVPQIVALPMLAVFGQLAAGRAHPWLPRALHDREFEIEAFKTVVDRARKYGGWIERIARPRLAFITGHTGARIVGAIMLIPAASILVPLPSTNTVPGIGVAIASLGLVERDGLLVILGLAIGLIWVALLVFVGAEAVGFIKDWLTARF